MSRPSLLFITPAFERYELSEIVMDQRLWLKDRLADMGIRASVVVIADDENLSFARARGFSAIRRDNLALGRRFNDGFEVAQQWRYDYCFPVGSDTWLLPDMFEFMVKEDFDPLRVHTGQLYGVVRPDGLRMSQQVIKWGVHHAYPVSVLPLRPAHEWLKKGVDTSVRKALEQQRPEVEIEYGWHHFLESVAFQSGGENQISSYDKLKFSYGIMESGGETPQETLSPLRSVYPDALVDRVVDYYASGRSGAAA